MSWEYPFMIIDSSFRTAIGITPDGPVLFSGSSINRENKFFYFYFNTIYYLLIREF
jgi:hypothetical protein